MGDPFVPAPCSSTPARPTYQVTTVGRRGPTHILPRRLSTSRNFGAPSHGIGTRCLRFAVRLTPPHARLASGCPARLYQAGLITRRVPKKGFRHVLHRFPLSHASWRKECPSSYEPPFVKPRPTKFSLLLFAAPSIDHPRRLAAFVCRSLCPWSAFAFSVSTAYNC